MRIGIDISQLAYEKTGVANYLKNLVGTLIQHDKTNEYVLFFSSLRKNFNPSMLTTQPLPKNVTVKEFGLPPTALDILWNRLHILPVEWLIGKVDMFITSDWTEPPVAKAKKATVLYDLIVYKYPEETAEKIVAVQKRKLRWVKKESDMVFCISESTKKDAVKILGIPEEKLRVTYPGL